MASYIWLWCIVVLARHSVCNNLFETDFASAAQLQVCVRTLCLLRHLWVDSGGIAQAAASLVVKSVHRCDLKREYQTWRLQHEAADLYLDNLTKWFRSHTRGFPRRKDKLCRGSKGRKGVASIRRKRTRKY